MTKHAREFAAFERVSAWIILNSGGILVAKVHAHYSSTRTTVTVYNWNIGADGISIEPQTKSASGYGYDKCTAAMSGLWVAGHMLTDHCDYRSAMQAKPGEEWPRDATPPAGFSFSNFRADRPHTGWGSCYREPGLDVLKAFGFQVFQAV